MTLTKWRHIKHYLDRIAGIALHVSVIILVVLAASYKLPKYFPGWLNWNNVMMQYVYGFFAIVFILAITSGFTGKYVWGWQPEEDGNGDGGSK